VIQFGGTRLPSPRGSLSVPFPADESHAVTSRASKRGPQFVRVRVSTTVDCRNPSESWTDVDGSRQSISWPSYTVDTQQYLAIGQSVLLSAAYYILARELEIANELLMSVDENMEK